MQSIQFLKSSAHIKQCPPEDLPEFAFIGRSNVGKSSLINMLTGIKDLAKISGKPGKTQLINHFIVDNQWYLVDLPGYGYAKVPKSTREKWEKMTTEYLLGRKNLQCIFSLIDVRHPPMKIDVDFIKWMGENNLDFILVFTKADKVSKQLISQNILSFKDILQAYWEELPMSVLSSAKSKLGKENILTIIESIIEINGKSND